MGVGFACDRRAGVVWADLSTASGLTRRPAAGQAERMHTYTSGQVFKVMRRHGVPVRVALRIIADLAPPDPLDRLEHHPSAAAFMAATAHYLRRVAGGENAATVKHDIRRLAWVVSR